MVENVLNTSHPTDNYNNNEDEEKDTKINIISHLEVLTCMNKLKDYLMASDIATESLLNYLLKIEKQICLTEQTKQIESTKFFQRF